jgi:mannose-1-phosphate guanylyltransferase
VKGVILAAGLGTRIRPLTDTLPKPMIPIVNRPVMEFLIDLLKQHGCEQIVISTSYLASQIETHFGDGSSFGVQLSYCFEGHHVAGQVVTELVGAAGGLRRIQDFSGFLDETFVVVCGDGLVDVDLTRALAFHREKGSAATMLLSHVPREDVGRYGVVQTDADGRILTFQEKPTPEEALSTTVNTGIYLFEPEVLDLVPRGRACDIAREFFPTLLARGVPFHGLALPFQWIDVGNPYDYWRATQMVLRGELDFVRMPGRPLREGIWGGINLSLPRQGVEGPLYVGSGTTIEPGAVVRGPTVIGRNCVIEAGAQVESCIVGDYTRVSGFADVKDRIISGRFCVDPHGRNVDLANRGYAFVIDDVRERREWTDEQRDLMDFLRSSAGA